LIEYIKETENTKNKFIELYSEKWHNKNRKENILEGLL